MKRYEYKTISLMYWRGKQVEAIALELNTLGREGWELCCSEYGHFFFKREVAP